MSAVLSVAPARSPWPLALGALVIAIGVIVGLYLPTFAGMVAIWARSDTFAHAYLVAPISLWLVWRKRRELAALTPRPRPVWLLALAGAAFLWLLGDLAGVNAVVQFAVVAMLVLTVPTLLGNAVAGAITFPLVFLFFMVPVGEFALPWMMEWTADFTVAALRFVGVPVYREGLQFMIPTGTWSVVEACSGVRYLIASFMVGTLFGYLNYRSPRRRWIFAGVSILVPIVANWLRAFMIVMLGHLSGNRIAVGVDHLVYGWVFFGIVILTMFAIGARWSEAADGGQDDASRSVSDTVAGSFAPALTGITLLLLLAISIGPSWASAAIHRPGAAVADVRLPALAGTADAPAATAYAPVFVEPSAVGERSYAFEGAIVTVHAAFYRDQTYGRKLGNSQNMLMRADDPLWHIAGTGVAKVNVQGQPVTLRSAELRAGTVASAGSGQARLNVRQVYWVDGQLTPSATLATLYAVRAQLLGRGDDSAAITVHVAGADPGAAQRTLDAFLQAHLPALAETIAAVPHAR